MNNYNPMGSWAILNVVLPKKKLPKLYSFRSLNLSRGVDLNH